MSNERIPGDETVLPERFSERFLVTRVEATTYPSIRERRLCQGGFVPYLCLMVRAGTGTRDEYNQLWMKRSAAMHACMSLHERSLLLVIVCVMMFVGVGNICFLMKPKAPRSRLRFKAKQAIWSLLAKIVACSVERCRQSSRERQWVGGA